jgi:hypothetical protein
MPHLRQRLAIAGLAALLALGGLIAATMGYVLIGVLGFVAMVAFVSWAARASTRTPDLAASPPGHAVPRPAAAPPDGHIRFTVLVQNLDAARIAEIWSGLCRPGQEATEEFRRLFRNFTVLEGNRFRFRQGDPKATEELLTRVLSTASGAPVRTLVEPAAERTPAWS